MSTFTLLLFLSSFQDREQPARIPKLVTEVIHSGRVLTLIPAFDDRIRIAPGAPPMLTFRYLDGRRRGRFGGLDLVLDDAGH
jgi:hypothetical protein